MIDSNGPRPTLNSARHGRAQRFDDSDWNRERDDKSATNRSISGSLLKSRPQTRPLQQQTDLNLRSGRFIAYLNGHRVARAQSSRIVNLERRATDRRGDRQSRQLDHSTSPTPGQAQSPGTTCSPSITSTSLGSESRAGSQWNPQAATGVRRVAVPGGKISSRHRRTGGPGFVLQVLGRRGLLGFWDGYSGPKTTTSSSTTTRPPTSFIRSMGRRLHVRKYSKLPVDRRAPLS
ncbi:MAG: hypothetical protein Ct9H300mP1_36080 [Planctomycetaceae bacterium]|nr:MAG: hypothetical protein Ct9H300mP1_36080 [Planctomycetaceae bacterium]